MFEFQVSVFRALDLFCGQSKCSFMQIYFPILSHHFQVLHSLLRYVGSSANLLLALTRGRRGNEINYTPSWLPFDARKEIEIIRIKRVLSNISLGSLRKFSATDLAYRISINKREKYKVCEHITEILLQIRVKI